MRHKKSEYTLRVNDREVSVICANKREGKHRAAQKMLQQLHPHITSWGPMLALYGSASMLSQKAKKKKEEEVTGLQSRNAARPAPNLAILEKLKFEMRALYKVREQLGPGYDNEKASAATSKQEEETLRGKFVPPLDASTPTISNTCLNKVDL